MSFVFRLICKACGKPVKTDEKKKAYVHPAVGIKFDHDVAKIISKRVE